MEVAKSDSISFLRMLAILFIGLKLGGIIEWSWLWVLAPLWGPFAFIALIFASILLFTAIVYFLAWVFDK